MKYVRQFVIIMVFTFLGEVLKALLPFPVPASIYGLLALLLALETKLLPLASVRDVGEFFVEIMPLTFIPAGVGLLESWGVMKSNAWQSCVNSRGIYDTGYGSIRSGNAGGDRTSKKKKYG